MEATSILLVMYLALRAFMICTSFQHQRSVPPGLCCRTSFSVNEDVIRNYALESHVFKTSTVDAITQCYMKCKDDCRCLSMNFIHSRGEDNCELSDVNKEMQPASLKYRFGVDYYDFVREFSQKKCWGILNRGNAVCLNRCCQNNPCLQGGTCEEICVPTTVRFNCTCQDDFTGQRCEQIKRPRSCKDLATNGVKASGMNNVYDYENKSFQIYCDFDSEPGRAWALIQSYSLENNGLFKDKRFGVDSPVHENDATINWKAYRLSLPRMRSIASVSTHLRATCNFPDEGLVFTDYARAKLEGHDLFGIWQAQCRSYEVMNIRGIECKECTVGTWQMEQETWHVSSQFSKGVAGCEFDGEAGAVGGEQNFGLYDQFNVKFRCTSSPSSATQHWLGSEI